MLSPHSNEKHLLSFSQLTVWVQLLFHFLLSSKVMFCFKDYIKDEDRERVVGKTIYTAMLIMT